MTPAKAGAKMITGPAVISRISYLYESTTVPLLNSGRDYWRSRQISTGAFSGFLAGPDFEAGQKEHLKPLMPEQPQNNRLAERFSNR